MYEFERLASGNVLFKKGTTILKSFPSKVYLSISPRNSDIIFIDSDPGTSQEWQQFEFKASTVTVPVNSGTQDLIQQLAEDFFLSDTVTIDNTGLATEPKQDAQITELQNIIADLANHLTELQSINTNTDGIETLLGDIDTGIGNLDTLLQAIDANTDNLEFLLNNMSLTLTNINTSLNNIETDIAAIEVLLTTISTNISTIITEIINNRTFGDTTNYATVAASASSVQLAAADTDRKQIVISNNASTTLWVRFGATAVLNTGIPLTRGSVYVEDANRGVVNGIWSGTPSGNALITETLI